ncbi:DoxX family protein [Planctomycetota bacterium]|nr:DoxX family protein [Planctomycetota bacterium]
MLRKVIFGLSTGIILLVMLGGGVMDLIQADKAKEAFDILGYPHYMLLIIGVAKVLAVVAILTPGFHKLKEWAYAGIVIDLIGAAASHVLADDSANAAGPIVFFAVALTSYLLRPKTGFLSALPSGPKAT